MPAFPVKTARELMDAEFDARWSERETIGPAARVVLGTIIERFVVTGGPIDVAALAAAPHRAGAAETRPAVAELDRTDLVVVRDDRVVLAYPFASAPTGFVVRLASGAERPACCAIDALGIAALLGEPIVVRARCHDCAEELVLPVAPDGPVGGAETMAWVGRRDTLRTKACDGL